MGQGHSAKSSGVQRSTSATTTRSGTYVDKNPNPSASTPKRTETPKENEFPESQAQSLQSKSYKNHARSTSSLGRIFQKKNWKKRRESVSASFNMHSIDMRVELLNVNTSTEEELMTLPGVNRALAQNIINHREMIGGFRKPEDLALVSGMGASKLSQIRPEICISKRRAEQSLASSKAPSIESIPSSILTELNRPNSSSSRNIKLLNINQATIFDLMTIDGVNQATAARIIEYRDKKGTFQCVDDIRRVGIHRRLLSAIKMYLTTEDIESDKSSTVSNIPIRPSRLNNKEITNGVVSNTIKPVNGSCQWEEDTKIIYDYISLKTKRPYPTKLFSYYHKNRPAYRVATWNLEALTTEKVSNPGVMEVITRTILENRFSILGVQEVCDKFVLQKICNELNQPTLRLNSEWTGYRGNWKCVIHPSPMYHHNRNYFLGVLYDSLRVDSVDLPIGTEFCPIQNGSLWQFAVFQFHCYSSTWVFVNVLSISLENGGYTNGHSTLCQKEITDNVNALVEKTDGAMIIGHFNAQQAQKGLKDMADLELVFPKTTSDNQPSSVWVTAGLKNSLADDHGIVEEGLTHLAIPNGWSLGGRVSKSGPVWCTLYGELEILEIDQELCPKNNDLVNDDYVPLR